MRVAYVCADRGVPVFGRKGASVHVQEILRAFGRRGHQVDLFAARVGGPPPGGLRGVDVHGFLPESLLAVARRDHEELQATNRALREALVGSGKAYDLVYERHALWSSSAMEYACERGIPSVLEVNAPLVSEQREYRHLDHPDLANKLVAKALRAARLRIAVSVGVAERHAPYGFSSEDFLICPNGIDPARFAKSAKRARDREADSPFTIGFLGTLKPWHGLPVLLDAFVRLARRRPEYRLLIVGDGPLRKEIEQRLASEGLDTRAELTGAVDPADVPFWLAKMDVGTAPYADGHYFSPLKVVEYMATGLPVVASRAGQIEELVSSGAEGWLVEPGSAVALSDCLERLRREPQQARQMGRRARSRVLTHHTWDEILDRVLRSVLTPASVQSKYDVEKKLCSAGGNC